MQPTDHIQRITEERKVTGTGSEERKGEEDKYRRREGGGQEGKTYEREF
jgi:hypothetical protein